MLTKFGRLGWRDFYRLPLAMLLWPLIRLNYWKREHGLAPDKWYWADEILLSWGWATMGFTETFKRKL